MDGSGSAEWPRRSGLDRVRVNVPAPSADRRPHQTVVRAGTADADVMTDDYFWLRDDARTSPEVIAHLHAENAYTDAVMRHTLPLQRAMYREMVGRIELDDSSVPVQRGGYWYYSRLEATQQYRIRCRKLGDPGAPEEVILDENQLALGHDYLAMGEVSPSPDGKLLAYSVNYSGTDVYDVYIKDLSTGQLRADVLSGSGGEMVWGNDSQTLYVTGLDTTQRSDRVWRHVLGTAQAADAVLFQEPDPEFRVGIGATSSRRFMVVNTQSTNTSEQLTVDLDNPVAAVQPIAGRTDGMRYSVEDNGGRFFVRTDYKAANFRIMEAPISNPGIANWTEVIGHDAAINIVSMAMHRDHLVLEERADGLPRMHIRKLSSGDDHLIAFPDPAYAVDAMPLPTFDTNLVRFAYSSLISPETVFEYDMDTRQRTALKVEKVVSGYDPTLYATERVFAAAADGTQVPISLVYKKTTATAANKPLLLYGYGAYGTVIEARFSASRLSLLDRGFTFAIAHVRGGGDLGEEWRKAGNMHNKHNTFSDFIACAEFLRDASYASPGQIAAEGRSAGGLLTGAVVNMRPDLFRAVIAGVPFVDVLNTMLDASIPLTTAEYTEWGDPNQKAAFDYMKSYSPYDNVSAQAYPHMLITGGLHDPRVGYWEPAKWALRLRDMKTDRRKVLLHMLMSGHMGQSGRFGRFEDLAHDYAWLLDAMGMAKIKPSASS